MVHLMTNPVELHYTRISSQEYPDSGSCLTEIESDRLSSSFDMPWLMTRQTRLKLEQFYWHSRRLQSQFDLDAACPDPLRIQHRIVFKHIWVYQHRRLLLILIDEHVLYERKLSDKNVLIYPSTRSMFADRGEYAPLNIVAWKSRVWGPKFQRISQKRSRGYKSPKGPVHMSVWTVFRWVVDRLQASLCSRGSLFRPFTFGSSIFLCLMMGTVFTGGRQLILTDERPPEEMMPGKQLKGNEGWCRQPTATLVFSLFALIRL